jgi:hypothetical protein
MDDEQPTVPDGPEEAESPQPSTPEPGGDWVTGGPLFGTEGPVEPVFRKAGRRPPKLS